MIDRAAAYLLPGRGEALSGPIGAALRALGAQVHGREVATLSTLKFGEQLAVIRNDLLAAWWHADALLIGHSYGAYLLLHTLADLPSFPGNIVLFAPVLGGAKSSDGRYGSRPPRAERLLALADSRGFAPPAHLDIHIGEEDVECNPQIARQFVAGIARATCTIVSGAAHHLSAHYIHDVLEHALQYAGCEPDAKYERPVEAPVMVPSSEALVTEYHAGSGAE